MIWAFWFIIPVVLKLQGAYEKFSLIELDIYAVYNYAASTYNKAMEWKFCQLSGFVWVVKLRPLIKYTDRFKQDLGELAYADLNSNFKFWGCLRPIWPLKSHISSFLFKYHIDIVFLRLWLLIGHFAIDLILLQKWGFSHSGLWPQ